MAKVGFGSFLGFLGSRQMVSGTNRVRFLMILSPVGNLTGSIFVPVENREQPYGKSWVWLIFVFLSDSYIGSAGTVKFVRAGAT